MGECQAGKIVHTHSYKEKEDEVVSQNRNLLSAIVVDLEQRKRKPKKKHVGQNSHEGKSMYNLRLLSVNGLESGVKSLRFSLFCSSQTT